MIVPAETLAFFENGSWVLYNAFARTALAVEAGAMAVLEAVVRDETVPQGSYTVWSVNWFSNETGLLDDPTRLLRDRSDWPEPEILSAAQLIERLEKLSLVVTNQEAYLERFAPKRSLLDFQRFGNFHQQLGQHLLAVKRIDPRPWWCGQKFTNDGTGIRENLYKFVQEAHMRPYFERAIAKGERVVDVGCGIGYYSRMMAGCGAEVIGVDPSADYMERAEKGAAQSPRFVRAKVGAEPMDMIEDGWADMVFMSDALLFYFIPEAPTQKADPAVLLADIHRMLRPGGRFISLEPHAAFFLAPRLGDPSRPFTVLTEYRHKRFGITPPLTDTLKTVMGHGFALTGFEELYPADASGEAVDPRGVGFASEFPQWQLLEFRKLG